MSLPTSRTYSSSRQNIGPDGATPNDAFSSLLDDILYQLSVDRGEETEGQFEQAEALADNAYTILSYIQDNVPAEQQADAIAEYLREAKFSSDVVSQMLNIPKSDVNAALAGAGYDETGQPLSTPSVLELLHTGPVSGIADPETWYASESQHYADLKADYQQAVAKYGENSPEAYEARYKMQQQEQRVAGMAEKYGYVGYPQGVTTAEEIVKQEKQTLIDKIREAGGEVDFVEGIADLGNLVYQAITLGLDPEPLYAVIPNIMDIIRGGIGGKLVLGPSGNQQSTVIGTGKTGVGRGSKVAIGGIFGRIANIFKQGGNLGTVITQFPTILIDNLPGVIAAAAAAGYAFTDNDKQTVVKAGLEPSILDATDDDKTATGGDDTVTVDPPKEPEAIKFTPTEQQYETVKTGPTLDAILGEQQTQSPAELLAMLGYESTETVKTPAELAAMLGYETGETTKTPAELLAMLGYETGETTRTPAELLAMLGYESTETVKTPAELAAMLGYETGETTKTPAELATMLGFDTATTVRSPGELTGMLGFDTATTVRSPGSLFGGVGYETAETTRTPAELAAMLNYETGQTVRTPAEIAAILGAENTQTIRSSGAPTLTTTLGGSSSPSASSGGLGYTTGARTVAVEPGPLVDIPGFYDISSRSIIPDYIDELIERNRERNLRRT